ncbi:8-amino-7-oxononanoate synthase [Clostridium botulinum]|uniref:8-amino-7-oxononanoate synthase n=1 Tax=Clostridium botulinum TaxID=1491 RepID=UPI0004D5EBAE|nr:8-amino-7-oxononanoate synthase [Clostridium botulinum]KEI03268.1 8-amino-7-oxononanoate synthase [Clostridium botulinum D str. 16868]KLU76493.1 8-amino-7-oxononanoate synthase [Clostridium botulinum V891]KOA79068.1 8-amino-7-oxononanoate synthase [Clostridium botulinum]KOA90676.1 8-amino-7-oxononanoate synthase [Clostridium botulinum]MCD3203803.1 8-amino-7-oxononanoate synthase [Clostridium botulinum C/D]
MEHILKKLKVTKENGLYRTLKYIETSQNPKVKIGGNDFILLGSNNYLGLCNDSRLKKAAINAINKYGVGSGGSRLTTGSLVIHKKLEESLAEFKNCKASLIFNTGYMANVGIIQSICNKDWVIFSDRLNHASIIDGCILSGAKLVRYKHCDMNDLLMKINKYSTQNSLIVTDGVFSMDGDIAPLPDIVKIAKQNNILTMVDDAHATGILGKNGSGTPSYFNLHNEIDIMMGTLSKAIASEGGYVAGKQYLIDYLKNFSRSFIYSTALSPSSIAVSLKAIEIIKSDEKRRENLLSLSAWFQKKLRELNFNIPHSKTPIIPIIIGDVEKTIEMSKYLLKEGIYIPAIRPPSVPNGTSRLRISLMATHTKKDLELVIEKLKTIGKLLNII